MGEQLDRATRAFWRARGRPVDLDGAHRWLAAPMHDTQRVGDGWLRTAAADLGATLREPPDAGLPRSRQPSVHVAFPLEDGNVQVFLQPSVLPDGALLLTSDSGDFGDNGAYVVVEGANGHHAARVPIHESFRVYVDGEGVLRTDHVVRLWSATVLRLHYKLYPF
jgi:hypothetical protein